MKGLVRTFAVIMTVTLMSAISALAADTGIGMTPDNSTSKDQCLLVAQTCKDNVDSLQQRIDRLHREINKGNSVYTNEELRSLEFQLKDAISTMDVLMRGGA